MSDLKNTTELSKLNPTERKSPNRKGKYVKNNQKLSDQWDNSNQPNPHVTGEIIATILPNLLGIVKAQIQKYDRSKQGKDKESYIYQNFENQ